jgi:5'-phosphate synthase pdxT subunit
MLELPKTTQLKMWWPGTELNRRRLEELGAEVVLVKKPEQLDEIDGLIIPGGESGTFLKLLGPEGFA